MPAQARTLAAPPPVDDLLSAPLDEVLERLGCDATGLSSAEASRRLVAEGPNTLTTRSSSGLVGTVARQLLHPLALLLWCAAGLALTTQGLTLGLAILAVIALNAVFAVVQERHAEHAVAALTEYLPRHATVLRDGRHAVVEAATVVPGDVLLVEEGAAVSADARILLGAVEVDLSTVTGESAPVLRQAADTGTAPPGARRAVDAEDVEAGPWSLRWSSWTHCRAARGRATHA